MRVIAKRSLRVFWQQHPGARGPLEAWHQEASKARWQNPQQIKERYASASFVGRERVVFNIGGNKYRLVVRINYTVGIIFIRFIGTHAEYDRINVEQV